MIGHIKIIMNNDIHKINNDVKKLNNNQIKMCKLNEDDYTSSYINERRSGRCP